jgi:hypothetical protein
VAKNICGNLCNLWQKTFVAIYAICGKKHLQPSFLKNFPAIPTISIFIASLGYSLFNRLVAQVYSST